jgi:hypothetical protein
MEAMMMKRKRSEKLVLTGPPSYIEHMAAHLKKEHPSTKHRLRIKK